MKLSLFPPVLPRPGLALLCLLFALLPSRSDGEILSNFDGQREGVADDRTSTNAFLGGAGKGWLRNWIFDKKGEGLIAKGEVMNSAPLAPGTENYVQITTLSEGEKGYGLLYRSYESYEDVDLAAIRTVKFLFRLDSEVGELTSGYGINFSEDRLAREVGGSWWISASGGQRSGSPVVGRNQEALVWNFYNGTTGVDFSGSGFIPSGMSIEKGVTYQFEITEDPVKRRWKATISDGQQTVATANPDDSSSPWLNYRYQAPKTVGINPAGHLLFQVAVPAGGSMVYSMTDLRIGAKEAE